MRLSKKKSLTIARGRVVYICFRWKSSRLCVGRGGGGGGDDETMGVFGSTPCRSTTSVRPSRSLEVVICEAVTEGRVAKRAESVLGIGDTKNGAR